MGALVIHSTDHNECRLLFPADCIMWLYSTLFFNTNMDDWNRSGSPSNKQLIIDNYKLAVIKD